MAITALPPAPSRQDPSNFADEADAWVAALELFTTEANALQTDVNTKQGLAATSETNAAASASSASASAVSAANSMTTAASAAGAPLWVSGTSYSQYAAVLSPTTRLVYRAIVAVPTSTVDPATDTTNWQNISGIFNVIVSSSASVSAAVGNHYILTFAGTVTVTLPATPNEGDTIWVTVTNDVETNVFARNGLTIMGLAENMTMDINHMTYKLRYVNSSWRLV